MYVEATPADGSRRLLSIVTHVIIHYKMMKIYTDLNQIHLVLFDRHKTNGNITNINNKNEFSVDAHSRSTSR